MLHARPKVRKLRGNGALAAALALEPLDAPSSSRVWTFDEHFPSAGVEVRQP